MQYIRKIGLIKKVIAKVKHLLNILIGKGPYRIKRFDELELDETTPINTPENRTFRLKLVEAKINLYEKSVFLLEQSCGSDQNRFSIESYQHCQRFVSGGVFRDKEKWLYSLENGCIFGSQGIVYDRKCRTAVLETARLYFLSANKNLLFSAFRLTDPKKIQGEAVSLAHTGADGGFYHFLIEALPKLALYQQFKEQVKFFLVSGTATDWKKKWLSRAGIDPGKIIWLEPLSHYQFDQLIFTSSLIADHQPTPWVVSTLRNIFGVGYQSTIKPPNAKLWLWSSRKSASWRQFQWEAVVQEKFPFIHFVDFSEKDPEEIVLLCQSCQVFVGPHGGGFSNIVFCKAGTHILEILPESDFTPLYARLASAAGLKHYTLQLDYKSADSPQIGIKALAKGFEMLQADMNNHSDANGLS